NQTARKYSQHFTRSFYTITDDGEYNVVLAEDGVWAIKSRSTGPIFPTGANRPLTQTMHIRVLWKPQSGSKPDAPSATNAIIDWYVRSNDSGGGLDHLHYRGVGFVAIYESRNESRFVIRNARMELTDSSGRLQDPLGGASITGSFLALRDDSQVTTALNVLHDEMAVASPAMPMQTGAHDGPPPRVPVGP
ncbi:MAG TPA: hypothetical protein VHD56_16580, partial [Tepidisphaeraceae bacterium]|nr:hypothetical protein [Tepidisphaeraceae bacterium]